ncbi:MAG: hydroxymethylbilane synthase [Bacteroidia bacterium]|nr:hydroxymethylbilane synthase [Bacteroidia bacterium]
MRLHLTVGTRSSQLALWQAQWVATLIRRTGHAAELRTIESYGDVVTDRPLAEIGTELVGKGVFTKALDDALSEGQIDLAVHSYKDVPTQLPEGLKLAALLPREDPHDVLVCRAGAGFLAQPTYPAVVATGSTRRQAAWRHRYPNHQVVDLRGNVQTRLKKLYEGTWDGAIFAAAGLRRLGLFEPSQPVLTWLLPAPAQGAIAIVCRAADHPVADALAHLNDGPTAAATLAERTVLRVLEGGCSAPVGALAEAQGTELRLRAEVYSPDGQQRLQAEATGPAEAPQALGTQVAQALLAQGAAALVTQSRHRA